MSSRHFCCGQSNTAAFTAAQYAQPSWQDAWCSGSSHVSSCDDRLTEPFNCMLECCSPMLCSMSDWSGPFTMDMMKRLPCSAGHRHRAHGAAVQQARPEGGGAAGALPRLVRLCPHLQVVASSQQPSHTWYRMAAKRPSGGQCARSYRRKPVLIQAALWPTAPSRHACHMTNSFDAESEAVVCLQDNIRYRAELQDHDRQPAAGVCCVNFHTTTRPWHSGLARTRSCLCSNEDHAVPPALSTALPHTANGCGTVAAGNT